MSPFTVGNQDRGCVWRASAPNRRPGSFGIVLSAVIDRRTRVRIRRRHYPLCHQKNGRVNHIPCAYFDQIMGNAYLMGLAVIYFVVLSPTGLQVSVETFAWQRHRW